MVACHAAVPVRSRLAVGSLVGAHSAGGRIVASYGIGRVHTTEASSGQHGALIGLSRCPACTVVDSYYDSARTGWFHSAGGTSKTTSNLQTPTSYSDTAGNAGVAIYSGWNVDVDDDGVADDPWNFGRPIDYPVLRGTSASVANVARQFALQPQVTMSVTLMGPASLVEGGAAEYTVRVPYVLHNALAVRWSVGTAPGLDGVQAADFADDAGMQLAGFPSGTATIPAGSSRTTFSVHVFDDPDAELRERFVVSVEGVADAGARVVLDVGSGSTAVTSIELSDGTDYDDDNDGLIDVATTQQLAAIRHDLEGRGLAGVSEGDRNDYLAAFDVFDTARTCPTTNMCSGYELLNDLDLSGTNWTPIGGGHPTVEYYSAVFEGNGYVISSMTIARSSLQRAGLFGAVSSVGTIRNVGLRDVNVAVGNNDIFTGSLVGHNAGKVAASYVADGSVTGGWSAGGLIGVNHGVVIASYADVKVNAVSNNSGGLIGEAVSGSVVSASYSVGEVTGGSRDGPAKSGGLVGQRNNSNAVPMTFRRATMIGVAAFRLRAAA